MKIKNTIVEIIQADITTFAADALILPANTGLTMDRGLAKVVRVKGGAAIEEGLRPSAVVAIGSTFATEAGALPWKKIIHSVLMHPAEAPDESAIRACCFNGLAAVAASGLTSAVIPAIGCGVAGYPPLSSAKLTGQEIMKHVRDHPHPLAKITVCVADGDIFEVFDEEINNFLTHIVEDLAWGPYVTTDIIIELDEGIVLVDRQNPPFGWVLPGGFVERGECLEDAARREAKEETDLDLEDLVQFHTYSDPKRDVRFHTVGTVFVARGRGIPKSGSDAKGLKVVPYEELLELEYAFDHKKVISDYVEHRRNQLRV